MRPFVACNDRRIAPKQREFQRRSESAGPFVACSRICRSNGAALLHISPALPIETRQMLPDRQSWAVVWTGGGSRQDASDTGRRYSIYIYLSLNKARNRQCPR